MLVQAEKKYVKDTSSSEKKRKNRTSTRKKMGMNQCQSSSLIMIDESPQVSPKDHNLSVLVDVVAHSMVNE